MAGKGNLSNEGGMESDFWGEEEGGKLTKVGEGEEWRLFWRG